MKDGSDEKMMSIFWLHWLLAPSLVSNRPKQTKVIERKLNFYFIVTLDLDHRHLGSNPNLGLDVSYPYNKFGVNRPKQTKVIEWKLNFQF